MGEAGREKGKLEKAEGKREKVGKHFSVRIPLGKQTARTRGRTEETKRNDFPVGLTPEHPMVHCFFVFSTAS